MDSLDKRIELQKQMYKLDYNHYFNVTLFSLKWWILLLIMILIIIIFCKLVDKKRLIVILLVGSLTGILVFLINSIGLEMSLWTYPMQLFELDVATSEIEIIIIPIVFMLLYQYVNEWTKYIIALILISAIGAFVVEPFGVLIGVYELLNWKYLHSFFVFICIGLIIKFIVSKIINVQNKYTV